MNVVYWLRDSSCDTPENSGYIGITHRFGRRVHEHRKRGRLPSFEAHILFVGSREECLAIERKYRPRAKIGWNNASGGVHGFMHSPESRAKIGASSVGKTYCLGRKLTEEHKAKIAKANRGRKVSDQERDASVERLRKANVGRALSEDHKDKLRKTSSGQFFSVERRAKISAALRGNKNSVGRIREDTRTRMVGNKYALGYHHSDAARAAISQKMKGRAVSQESREKMRLIAVKRSAAKNSRQLELGF